MINKSVKILIIDDDVVDRTLSKRMLKNSDEITFDIVEATNIKEATDLLKKDGFDCILLDYQLPDGNGVELLTELRKNLSPFIPIIMLTGQGSEDVAVTAMKAGATDYLAKSKLDPTLMSKIILSAIKNTNLEKIINEQKEKIQYYAFYDHLTGLVNRHTFEELLGHALLDAKKLNLSLIIILIDIDNFMKINDSVGHLAGDKILMEAAKRLRDEFSHDIIVSRFGEDEFSILIKWEEMNTNEMTVLMEKISTLLKKPYEIPMTESPQVTVSIGAAYYLGGSLEVIDLLRNASTALTQAKNAGGNVYKIDR